MSDIEGFGHKQVLANAYLREGLGGRRPDNFMYSPAQGTGTSPSPMVARFMAISEGLERWAHWELHAVSEGSDYGFDVDPSSNGMGAFPGLFARQARRSAQWEATERFNVLNWWEGNLEGRETHTRWPGVRAIAITSPAPGIAVILHRRTDEGFFAYGHAAALDFESACLKAAHELERYSRVVSRFAVAHGGQIKTQLPPTAHPIERRTLFFAR